MKQRGLLIILDGFGINPDVDAIGNAIQQANTPTFDYMTKYYPNTYVETSGQAVGLPEGQMGNSEIGHMNIGAGRVVYSELERISKSFRDGTFSTNSVLQDFFTSIVSKRVHLWILLSDGGVHSTNEHLYHMIDLLPNLYPSYSFYIHAFLDGRDTSPCSGVDYVKELLEKINSLERVYLASLIGRFYAMDRDSRWERTEKAYRLIFYGEGADTTKEECLDYILSQYEQNITDEFFKPTCICPDGIIENGDAILFCNFRGDRARQIIEATSQKGFSSFRTKNIFSVLCMTEYKKDFSLPVLFSPIEYQHTLGEVLSNLQKTQVRISETEKYAHVTFFFNCGKEDPFIGESRVLIDSPKVRTYDEKPEMSAFKVKEAVISAIKNVSNDVIIVNFANADMLGHTGNLSATVKAVEVLDTCIKDIIDLSQKYNIHTLITADHGNCEEMVSPKDKQTPFTQHTTYSVPLFYVPPAKRDSNQKIKLKNGRLSDLAPTLLECLDIAKEDVPLEMTGKSLLSI